MTGKAADKEFRPTKCPGCEHLEQEHWVKGRTVYRCMAQGEKRGRVVEILRDGERPSAFITWLPAWCPRGDKMKGE